MDSDALTKASRRDLLIAGSAVLVVAVVFGALVLRPASPEAAAASRAMNPFVASALAVAASGLLALALRRRVVAAAAAVLTGALGLIALASSTLGIDPGLATVLGRRAGYVGAAFYVPTTSSVCVLLIAAAELLAARTGSWRRHATALGMLGMSVVALAIVGGLTDMLGLGPPFMLGRGAPMSPVTALALAAVGAAMVLVAWRSSGGSPAGRAPAWLPAVVGIGAGAATLVLWWAAAGQEHAGILRRVESATRMMASDLRSNVALVAAPVGNLARGGAGTPGAASAAWRADAARLAAASGSAYAAIGWVPARAGAGVTFPVGDSAALASLGPLLRNRGSWESVPGSAVIGARAHVVLGGDTALAVFVPAVTDAVMGEGAVAIVRLEPMLAAVFAGGGARGFEYQLRLGPVTFGAPPRRQDAVFRSLVQTAPVDATAPHWQLTVWPVASRIATMTTPMDEIVLAAGLTVAALLALLARLWQQARARTVEVEIAHRNLAADVVRHERLEAQLRQSQKMEAVGQLTGGIAHDLNNVLTVVVANAELMASAVPADAPELRAELAQLHSAASRGAGMVRQLLAFSRRKPLVPGPLDLVHLVDESSGLLRRLVPENIVIRVAHEAPRQPVMGDGGAIEQVLVNLVTNARDAMPDGGTLRLETVRATLSAERAAATGVPGPGVYGCLVIADTGVGMDAATRERAFEPFFTTKEPGAGTGLGLSMVYALVQQLGGGIELASEPGAGTTITLYLPAAAGPEAAAAPDRAATPATLTGDETILVVEDEAAIRRATQRVLERHGYRVLLAENGEQGLDLYRRHAEEIDLVLSDLIMPRVGGRALYETLRGEGARVRFLFASGYASPETEEAASLAGVPHIAKPWTIGELLGKVREVLDGEVMK